MIRSTHQICLTEQQDKNTMKNTFCIILLFCFISAAFCQEGFERWNERYTTINLTGVMKYETAYADSVDRGLIEGRYYARFDRYQIKAEYLGMTRDVADSIRTSMKNVNKLFGEKEFLPVITAVQKEFLFRVDGTDYWFPIQHVLEKAFQDEIMLHDTVILYCMHFNEHQWNKALYNSFLIAEFRKE